MMEEIKNADDKVSKKVEESLPKGVKGVEYKN
jgi:hypothetical protein